MMFWINRYILMGFLVDYIGFLWLWGISVGYNHVNHIDLTHLMSREQFFFSYSYKI